MKELQVMQGEPTPDRKTVFCKLDIPLESVPEWPYPCDFCGENTIKKTYLNHTMTGEDSDVEVAGVPGYDCPSEECAGAGWYDWESLKLSLELGIQYFEEVGDMETVKKLREAQERT